MTTPKPNPTFDVGDFVNRINNPFDDDTAASQSAAEENQAAQVGEQTGTLLGSLDQATNTLTSTEAGDGGAGGVAVGGAGGSADGGSGFGFGGVGGSNEQFGKTNINFGDAGDADGVGVGGSGGVAGRGGDADAAGGDGGGALSEVGVDASANQDQESIQDLPQTSDQENESTIDAGADIDNQIDTTDNSDDDLVDQF